jgi:hypothetical protein
MRRADRSSREQTPLARPCRPSTSAEPDQTPALEAEGQVARRASGQRWLGDRSVSFLVSFMFVYLRPPPATTGRRAGRIDQHGRSWTVILHPEKRKVDSSILSLTTIVYKAEVRKRRRGVLRAMAVSDCCEPLMTLGRRTLSHVDRTSAYLAVRRKGGPARLVADFRP